jgi:hypothetical protein
LDFPTSASASRLGHDGRVPDETTSEQLRRESDELLETAAKLIEHAATLRAQAAELQKQISRPERNTAIQSRKL